MIISHISSYKYTAYILNRVLFHMELRTYRTKHFIVIGTLEELFMFYLPL